MSETLYYFGYGSNLFVPRIVDRVPSARIHTTAVVPGYQLCFHKMGRDGSSKANMYRTDNPKHHIRGAVYEIHASEKPTLDKIEDVEAGGYVPHEISIVCDRGESLAVFVYLANESAIDTGLQPYSWYRDLVLHGARSHQFPDYYCDTIATVQSIEDADAERDRVNRYGVL